MIKSLFSFLSKQCFKMSISSLWAFFISVCFWLLIKLYAIIDCSLSEYIIYGILFIDVNISNELLFELKLQSLIKSFSKIIFFG